MIQRESSGKFYCGESNRTRTGHGQGIKERRNGANTNNPRTVELRREPRFCGGNDLLLARSQVRV